LYDARTAAIYDLLYDANVGGPLRDGSAEAAHILELVRTHSPHATSLLDVGCGTGRHLSALGDGLAVHGLDINAGFLEVARQRCPSAVFHHADMEHFALDRRFDVITCLFSSIAYSASLERLGRTIDRFVRHLSPDGMVIVEPWFTPERFWDGHVSANVAARPGVKIAWMHQQRRDGRVSWMDVHYLVATSQGVGHYEERHELGLFTDDEYRGAMERAGLAVAFDPVGFGRGLYIGSAAGGR
jgi:SAM-dependent methyltransferase